MTATTPELQAGMLANQLIRAERDRQIHVEGYTPEHDLKGGPRYAGQLLKAAIAYRTNHSEMWPWAGTFKPKDPIRNLVRAGALVLAAMDVLEAIETDETAFQRDQAERALEMTTLQLAECITSLQALADERGWQVALAGPTVHEDAEAFLDHLDSLTTPHDKLAHLKANTTHYGAPALATDVPSCPRCREGVPMTFEEAMDLHHEQHGEKKVTE